MNDTQQNDTQQSDIQHFEAASQLLYFIQYNAHTGIVRTWISQWFLAKKNFYFSRIISQELIIGSLFIIKAILTLPQLPSMYSA
jgi:hypothetical protein